GRFLVRKDIVYLGDLHIKRGERWEECVRVMTWIAEYIERVKPSAVVVGGDIYDGNSDPEEREFFSDWAQRIAAVCPLLVIRGNHDRLKDLRIIAKLSGKHPIIVEEGAGVHRIAGCKIAAMAWPQTAILKASGLDERTALQNVLRGLGAEMAEDDGAIPICGAGHWLITGSVSSTGQPLLGLPVSVSLEELAMLNVPVVLASHIHKHQSWHYGKTDILFAGSPFRCNFGESESKYVIHVTWENGITTWGAIETPARAMLFFDAEWNDGLEINYPADLPGAECRLRYRVDSDQREAAAAKADETRQVMLAMGAYSVKLEERVIAKTRARVPEMLAITDGDPDDQWENDDLDDDEDGSDPTLTPAASEDAASQPRRARSMTERQLEVLWKARSEDIDPLRKARLLEKVSTIDTEAA
ncbi:MAG TPA: metallophosphoesterase, partial [Polyangiaceae bacterium]|nr:metallophosphoesterase [Polyangiaceae bacterium]